MKNLLLILVTIVALGCKVSYSFRGGEIPGQTFSIESITNTASLVNPNLAIVLQDALQEKFTNESNLKYTNGIGDAQFTGVITRYTITPEQGTGSDIVALNRLTISIKITYTNSENGDQDFNKTFESYDNFKATEDSSSIEDELMESISKKLVDLVYNETLMEW